MNDLDRHATTRANLLDRIVEKGGYELPDGTDMWAVRSVHPDLRSSRDYRWPFPGNWAEAPGPIREDNTGPCPEDVGDGLCVATTWVGMATGGVPAIALLLCAINTADALSPVDADKIRVRRAYVVDVIDGARTVREHGVGADLRRANLSGANLYWASLSGANLGGVNLSRADLDGASLSGANLGGADLDSADLPGADLYWANLCGANLRRANLYWANLSAANLSGANLYGANLSGANLARADLTRADLTGANLSGARWDEATTWPRGFNPEEATK